MLGAQAPALLFFPVVTGEAIPTWTKVHNRKWNSRHWAVLSVASLSGRRETGSIMKQAEQFIGKELRLTSQTVWAHILAPARWREAFSFFKVVDIVNIFYSNFKFVSMYLSYFLIVLFIHFWLHWVLVAALRIFIVVRSFSCGAGLSCSWANGSLVSGPGIEPLSPTLEGEFLTTGPPGKSLSFLLKFLIEIY